MCTVFAESEVISLLSKECSKADIAAAIHEAIARRISGMVSQVGMKERVVMVGGVAKNTGVEKLERMLNTTFLIPPEPQINGRSVRPLSRLNGYNKSVAGKIRLRDFAVALKR